MPLDVNYDGKMDLVFSRDNEVNLSYLLNCNTVDVVLETISLNNSDFIVFPNPVVDQLHLRALTAETVSIVIYNGLQQSVYSDLMLESKKKISLDFLPKGIYYLKFQSALGQKTMKVIKE